MNFSSKMKFFDLKYFPPSGHTSAYPWKEMADEYRKNRLCSTDGLCSILRVPKMRAAVQRKLQGDHLLVPGSIPLPVFRTAYIPREPQRHRGLPARGEAQALPHGHPGQGLPKYPGPCQRGARLEDLRRLRPKC